LMNNSGDADTGSFRPRDAAEIGPPHKARHKLVSLRHLHEAPREQAEPRGECES